LRVSDGHSTIAYLSDHAPIYLGAGPDGQGELHDAAMELATDVDLLIHDAQFVADEFPGVGYLGHASVEYAMGLARAAGAPRHALFHHSPERTDDEIDRIVAERMQPDLSMFAAVEGGVVPLHRAAATAPT
jgi:phosphoribosyl 1,2-cyclic phosphodiesterase